MTNNVDKILGLCDDLRANVVKADGTTVWDDKAESLRLINNDILYHNLDYEEINAACVGLTEVMVPIGFGGYICKDHMEFWRWVAQLLLTDPATTSGPISKKNINQLFGVTISLMLGGSDYFWADIDIQRSKEYDHQLKNTITHKLFIIKYLVYPLLESVLRYKCSSYVSEDGKAIISFTVNNRTYNNGQRCNSIKDLLSLFEREISSNEIKHWFSRLDNHFSNIVSGSHLFNTIHNWRNATLHGDSEITAVSGTALNFVILILLEDMGGIYDTCKNSATEFIEACEKSKYGNSNHYYKI